MVTVMEFSVPAAEFPLGSVFESLPEVTVELERLIPHDSLIIPYFWVRGADPADIESSFDAHPGIVSVTLVDEVDDEYLMRVEWAREYFGILNALAETKLVVLAGVGRRDGWTFEVRGESTDDVSAFHTLCQKNDIPIEVTAIHALLPTESEGHRLTDAQHEALVLAYERGYFDTPRETTLEAIAAELGITQQSLSSRLRRGHRRLIDEALITT